MTYEEMRNLEKDYRNGKSKITDEEWDKLVQETGYKETLQGEYDKKTSCGKTASGRNMIKMIQPAVSIQKAYNEEQLLSFMSNFNKEKCNQAFTQTKNRKFIIEPKLDGNFFVARYKKNGDILKLSNIGSGGDGIHMYELNESALDQVRIYGLPKEIPLISPKLKKMLFDIDGEQYIEIRGEAIINKDEWGVYNPDKLDLRSKVSGIMNRKVPASLAYFLNLEFKGRDQIDLKSNPVSNSKSGIFKVILDVYKDADEILIQKNENDLLRSTILIKNKDREEKMNISTFFFNVLNGEIKANVKCKINCIVENVYFITYGIANKDGCLIPYEILKNLDIGLIMFKYKEISGHMLGILEEVFEEGCGYILNENLRQEEKISFIKQYTGWIFGREDWYDKSDWKPARLNMSFMCDGVVVKEIAPDFGIFRTGKLGHHPTNRLAIKIEGTSYKVFLEKITTTITEKGNTTCHGLIKEIEISGVKYKNINLHNPKWLEKNPWIQEGKWYNMILSADLIPVLKGEC